MTKINANKVSKNMSHTIKELVVQLGVDKKTIFRWIDEGLKTLEGSKSPILIVGSDLKDFIRKKNSKNKIKLGRHQFYCFTCKTSVRSKRGSLEIKKDKKIAKCAVCNGKVVRIIKPSQKDYKITSPPVQMSIFDS